ncbi:MULTISPECIES: Trk system potassium transporter TrkA [unclassified Lentimonas]|uniref:Trk system potassium transporter TrkA n=1 Tax=unclassified Lentimonas TaxID=2630993 RepID=UPI00132A7786|nr:MULTISPECIES: Trk system potassium transporter TrkA [unclassified Lentimonas]CAA6676430.1 Trk system potassium uptake protein TrkA [Lentimonas sp. CC4]CAA6685269.1 Trk system potassium uptake protein TrkA [Lentimonas sp. CC6]CAA6690346.1 Trk system potassium uptake protein TrkA [Lentimonas sp. CC10]CAA6693061.1 Trk system potassium uptake protein TrkA [Lentimonas sp. CC19]CAA7069032.1 Trk system potassium uptake protein TrkA [Lentimonas sp. CC11]
MKIIIVGAGEVGHNLCTTLSASGHDVTLIERSPLRCEKLDEEQNARIIQGNGSSARQLVEVDVAECDAFLAMTSDDRTNVISCSLAKGLGAKNTIARIHDETYSDNSVINYQLHFGIDLLVNPEAICAVELAKEIRGAGRVAVENFARGQIEVQQQRVAAGSRLIGKQLKDLKFDPRVRIGYIQRNGISEIASADSIMEEGDLVTHFGHPEALFAIRQKFDPKHKVDLSRVVLFGASETAINLIQLLTNPRFKIRVIEKNPEICRQLAERFPHITVINGDATSLRLLEEEQIGSADYFVGCTKDDEENILTCIQASKLGAKHVQLVINKGDYDELLGMLKTTLAIEVVVSPRRATADFMLRTLSTETVAMLAELPAAGGRILEVRISHSSPCVGRSVKDLQFPRGSLLVALQHKFKAKVPAADDIILAGDRVVVIVTNDQEKALLERLV